MKKHTINDYRMPPLLFTETVVCVKKELKKQHLVWMELKKQIGMLKPKYYR